MKCSVGCSDDAAAGQYVSFHLLFARADFFEGKKGESGCREIIRKKTNPVLLLLHNFSGSRSSSGCGSNHILRGSGWASFPGR